MVVDRSVVDHVAGKERAGRRLPEGDTARRVTGQVQYGEAAVAQVEDVTLVDQAGRWRGADLVGLGIEAGVGIGGEDLRGHVVGNHRVVAGRMAQDVGLAAVDQALLELEVRAHVIEMAVARHAENRLFAEQGDVLAQGRHAHPGIEQQIPVAAAHVPDVAAYVGIDVRFPDQGHVVAEAPRPVPGLRDGLGHVRRTSRVVARPPAGRGRSRAMGKLRLESRMRSGLLAGAKSKAPAGRRSSRRIGGRK